MQYGYRAMIVSAAYVARYYDALLYFSSMVGSEDRVIVFATRYLVLEPPIEDDTSVIS